jgi:hypothetical protein
MMRRGDGRGDAETLRYEDNPEHRKTRVTMKNERWKMINEKSFCQNLFAVVTALF